MSNQQRWASAVCIFDAIAKPLIEGLNDTNRSNTKKVLKVLAETLEDCDWDTQGESSYWEHPLIQEIFRELGTISEDE